MSVFQAATRDGGVAEIGMTAVTALDEDLRGSVLLPTSPGYDDARRIWNAMRAATGYRRLMARANMRSSWR